MAGISKLLFIVALIGGGGFAVREAIMTKGPRWDATFESNISYDGGAPCNVASVTVDKTLFAVIAVAGAFKNTERNETKIGRGPTGTGSMTVGVGREVGWSYAAGKPATETAAATPGTVTIDGRAYNLADGGLFLVSEEFGGTSVVQRPTMPSRGIGGVVGTKQLETVANEEPAVALFLRDRRESR